MNKTLLTAITIAALLPFGATAIADTHASEKTGSDMYAGISVGKAKHNITLNLTLLRPKPFMTQT